MESGDHVMETSRPAAGRRELWGWVGLTVLGCLLVLLAASQVWVLVPAAGAHTGGGPGPAPTGGELSPVLTPVALAALAGVVAVLATKGIGRRVVGGLLALCGAGAAAATWTALDGATVTARLAEANILSAGAGLPWEVVPGWPVVSAAGAVLLVTGGVVAIVRGNRWAGMSTRYDRGAGDTAARGHDGAEPAHGDRALHGDKALWDALDRGDDPTDSR
ncbi:TIGR02234 family membrane protein [Nonomuraea sp. K274]|uniref:TIGR02234 family membrane protein n=1 Tax=Nonomuraea cypriaca TaxID=1187855 RepID=A0A931F246_9ACTN|nr:TIGR02234 family membrane protein [Nonomuraea cypriaca]MBF8188721.1 TIGR02234 family membrane protein [Nonomuraea cypriaca]